MDIVTVGRVSWPVRGPKSSESPNQTSTNTPICQIWDRFWGIPIRVIRLIRGKKLPDGDHELHELHESGGRVEIYFRVSCKDSDGPGDPSYGV